MGKGKDGSTIIREIVAPSNPKTVSQALQRMKLAPAHKFYAAFSELLSNAFQGKSYGDDSRMYFLSKCMTADGPYIQKGVDRFIPAAYLFSEGSLPSVGILPFSGGATVITLGVTTDAAEVTPQVLAAALQVSDDYQITVAVVNNVNGIFTPSYISYDQRLKISDLPANTLGKDANGNITFNPAALGLDMSAMIACCIVLSTQDASGNYLRSTQEMVISEELRASIYGADAMEAAIYSYQDNSSVNSINSEWYYNLGMSQLWDGKLATVYSPLSQDEHEVDSADVVIGLKQIDGRIKRYVFATSTEDTGLVICVVNGRITTFDYATVAEFRAFNLGYTVELWQDSYATQLGVMDSNTSGGGSDSGEDTRVASQNFFAVQVAGLGEGKDAVMVDAEGHILKKYQNNMMIALKWNEESASYDYVDAVSFSDPDNRGSVTYYMEALGNDKFRISANNASIGLSYTYNEGTWNGGVFDQKVVAFTEPEPEPEP